MFSARAPVSTRIFALRNCRSSSFETSSSSTGTMRGSISMSVTSEPKRSKMEANSTPTAPAPMIASVFGTAVRSRISMLVRMVFGSGSRPGQHAGFRAGGEDDVLRLERARSVPVADLHLPPPLRVA